VNASPESHKDLKTQRYVDYSVGLAVPRCNENCCVPGTGGVHFSSNVSMLRAKLLPFLLILLISSYQIN
jgi:hypothetical protein